MTEPLKPHEVVAHAALVVADPEAQMRKELEQMIRDNVAAELDRLLSNPAIGLQIVQNNSWTIQNIALRAVKNYFNSPTQIN